MANNLWVGAVTADLAANRPTTPGASISAGSGTNEVVACYSGAAWVVVALIKDNA